MSRVLRFRKSPLVGQKPTVAREENKPGPDEPTTDIRPSEIEVYEEGEHIIIEDGQGEVLAVESNPTNDDIPQHVDDLVSKLKSEAPNGWT